MKREFFKWIAITNAILGMLVLGIYAGWKVRANIAAMDRAIMEGQAEAKDRRIDRLERALDAQAADIRIWEGRASWYGQEFAGKPTRSGEIFDPEGATAAHRSLPDGTILAIENPLTGKWAIVRINDWGPDDRFIPPREIDLSERIARELGMIDAGVVPVRIYEIKARNKK